MKNKAQQEIVGFVLIVVLVVVGLMVFLVISLRDAPENKGSLEVRHMLDALMKHTTECAIVYEPDYEDFEDLFKSCHQGDQCSNLNKSACEYLNESLSMVIDALMTSEATVGAYQIDFFVKDDEGGQQGHLQILEGNCTGNINSAQRSFGDLVIRMKVCSLV